VLIHPAKPAIPAGLSALPRQLAGFPEYRLALLHDIPTYAPLAQWRAREGDDLGIMLLEMGAYVLDILGFAMSASPMSISHRRVAPSIRKLVINRIPGRPALAASALAATPRGTGRSCCPAQASVRMHSMGAAASVRDRGCILSMR
jgi:hypothetical protein